MTAQEIRQAYLDFFKKKGHVEVPRAQLVPRDDPTTLFTGSGMQPLIPYLLGEQHPDGRRLVNSQTCLRAQDIDEVGDASHTTFFEMLGNWSLGDYFKSEQISWFAEFLFDVIKLDPEKVYVSCYKGNKTFNVPEDIEAVECWKKEFKARNVDCDIVAIGSADDGAKKGMQGGRIFLYDGDENWWSRGGNEENTPVGEPCGPDSEVFYDFGEVLHDEKEWGKPHPASDSPRFMEIGNSVFMSYRRLDSGFEELPAKNIDFGGGLERIAAASVNSPDVFRISLLWPIIEKLEELSGKKYESHTNAMRVIADHLRGAVFLAFDGVEPSNKEQGYVARRLMRRAILKAFDLGIEQNFLPEIIEVVVSLYRDDYPEIAKKEKEVINVLSREENLFKATLRSGLRQVKKTLEKFEPLTGRDIFRLYDTYGFPTELTLEEAAKKDVRPQKDWQKDFDYEMKKQRERSQTATKGVFKGGLADHSNETKKLHTATHLMYEALRQVLGDHVVQRGSNVNAERTRFDFSHPEKVTKEQQAKVEKIVNEQIEKDLKVEWKEYSTDEAFKLGAKGAFGDKYGDKVKVYSMRLPGEKPFSIEICGGPHVDHTGQLAEGGKRFKIKKEEASSSGVRRIKAVLLV